MLRAGSRGGIFTGSGSGSGSIASATSRAVIPAQA